MFPASFLEEIRTRLPTSAVVGRKVKLRKQGREFAGLSPFNGEKTPSFFVNDQKARWFDFSAGKNGDVFSFLMETEGVTFNEAVERLAGEAGLSLPKSDPGAIKREARKATLSEVCQMAGGFFQAQLAKAEAARAYLDRRKFKPAMIERFKIGFAPDDRSALKQFLAHEGVDQDTMAEAGLIIVDESPVSYDRFRGRIMFPICDLRGRPVGFGGRALGESPAKYLNTPETPIFDKGRILYNAHNAREPAHKEAPLVVAEGYAAVVSSTDAGFPASVAPMGTSLTDDQLLGLWRLSDEPIVCFDGDAAGQRAAKRAVNMALPQMKAGRSMRFAFMPAGLDPDDVVRERGREAYASLIGKAASFIDSLWRLFVARPLVSPDERAAVERELMTAIDQIPDVALRSSYRDDVRDRIKATARRPNVYRSNGHSHHSASPGSVRLAHGVGNAPLATRDAALVAAICLAPSVALEEVEELAARRMSPRGRELTNSVMSILSTLPEADSESLLTAVRAAGIGSAIDECFSVCQSANLQSLTPGNLAGATAVLKG